MGIVGIACEAMYTANAAIVGTGTDLRTLVLKTIVVQFVWTPFVFAIPSSVLCLWIACDCSLRRLRCEWPENYWTDMFVPYLVSNWVVWIPVMLLVHLFPTPLQIQLSGLVGAFWTLVGLAMGRHVRPCRRQADMEQP